MTPQERRRRLEALERKLHVTRAPKVVIGYRGRGPDGAEVVDWPNGEPRAGDHGMIVTLIEGEEAVTP